MNLLILQLMRLGNQLSALFAAFGLVLLTTTAYSQCVVFANSDQQEIICGECVTLSHAGYGAGNVSFSEDFNTQPLSTPPPTAMNQSHRSRVWPYKSQPEDCFTAGLQDVNFKLRNELLHCVTTVFQPRNEFSEFVATPPAAMNQPHSV